MLLVKDDFSRFSAVCFMKSKNEAFKYFKQYLTANSPQFNGVAERRTAMKRVNREGSLNSSEMYVLWYGHSVE